MSDLSHILSPTTSPATDTLPRKRVRRIVNECVGSDLSSWEHFEFLPSIANRCVLTEKQEKVLAGIEARASCAGPLDAVVGGAASQAPTFGEKT